MRHVLITGCSTGIGYCLATRLQQYDFNVLATARKQSDVEKLTSLGLSAHKLDLADSQSIADAVQWSMEQSRGLLYGLVNNGAYGQPGAVEDLSRDALVEQFQTNVFGTQELTNLVIPSMRAHDRGRIIQISSILGLVCLPYRGAYNASKYALEALTDTLRLELSNTGIALSLIEPGPIESNFRNNALRMFYKHVRTEHSAHLKHYQAVEVRLQAVNNVPFTLPAEAVLNKVAHALKADKPRIRYKVTVPAVGLAFLKRLLPDRLFDGLVGRI